MKIISLLIFCAITAVAPTPPVSYRQLSWEDFKGKPTNEHIASSCTGIVIERDTAYAIFEPDKSWTKTSDVATLRHEQLHFAITKYFAGWICENIQCAKCLALPIKLQASINEDMRMWGELEDRYDRETNHGQDTAAQRQWEERIKL